MTNRIRLLRTSTAALLAGVSLVAATGPLAAAVPAAVGSTGHVGAPARPSTAGVPTTVVRVQDPVVLYASTTADNPVKVDYRVDISAAAGVGELGGILFDPDNRVVGAREPLQLISGTPQQGTWGNTVSFTKNAKPGRYRLVVEGEDTDGNSIIVNGGGFSVKRNTRMPAWNASPEPVGKGARITTAGRLIRLDPERGYVGYRNKTVQISFRAAGSSQRTLVGTATTDARGQFRTSFRAARDGVWYATFPGTAYHDRQGSGGDFVDVR